MAEQTPQTPPHSSEPNSGVSVESLPNELLNHIFGYLDTPPPSASTSRLRDEPDFEITHSKTTDLKVISYVSKKWRAVVLPTLFRNVQFTPAQGWHCDFDARKKAHPFFNYLKQHSLSELVTSFTLNVPYLDPPHEGDTALVVKDLEVFWKDVFDVIDPLDVLIVAPPEALGLLTGCHIGIYDTETYEAPYHYLRLHRPLGALLEPPISLSENPTNESSDTAPRTGNSSPDNSSSASPVTKDTGRQSIILGIRPWKSLVLNEGSFVRGYVGDFQSPAPSILTDLFGCVDIPRRAGDAASTRGRGALINPSIREISYIAIFPPEVQFAKFAYFLPPVDSVYVQFVPRNGILDDKERMNYIDSNELWFQRNSCYATIMRELFTQPPSKNYATLREFESGDSADRDAWNMAVEFVKRAGAGIGWEVESDGVFIRDPKHAVLGEETDQSELSTLSVTD